MTFLLKPFESGSMNQNICGLSLKLLSLLVTQEHHQALAKRKRIIVIDLKYFCNSSLPILSGILFFILIEANNCIKQQGSQELRRDLGIISYYFT